jgi:hypothetical protein
MPRPSRLVLLHAVLVTLGTIQLARALQQDWLRDIVFDDDARVVLQLALPIASGVASVLAIVLGMRAGQSRRALSTDLAGLATAYVALGLLARGPETRDVVGLLYMAVVTARLLPSALLVVRGIERSALAVFVLTFAFYASAGLWAGVASAAQGDQPHYLLAADALARGSADLAPEYRDPALFKALSGTPLGTADIETHIVVADRGGRLVQGYALSVAIAPGWAIGGRNGALLVMALLGALCSVQLLRFCVEVAGDGPASRSAWALVTFLAPLSTLATVIFPNLLGAFALLLAYRWLFTAPVRRPVLAGLAGGVLLLLTPRDAVALAVLVPFAFVAGRAIGLRFALTVAASFVAISIADLALYGLAVPYAGYAFGIDAAQRLEGVPSLHARPEIGLGGMLFDRAFGLAGSAPWIFLGLVGIGPALKRRATLLPAFAVVVASLASLSIYRLWEGGWSPPNRYFLETLPLWTPFIALGLVRPSRLLAAIAAVLVALGAAASFLFLSVPNLQFNDGTSARVITALDRLLILDPLGLLPSFEDAGAIGPALLRSVPLVIAAAALVIAGLRRGRETAT